MEPSEKQAPVLDVIHLCLPFKTRHCCWGTGCLLEPAVSCSLPSEVISASDPSKLLSYFAPIFIETSLGRRHLHSYGKASF